MRSDYPFITIPEYLYDNESDDEKNPLVYPTILPRPEKPIPKNLFEKIFGIKKKIGAYETKLNAHNLSMKNYPRDLDNYFKELGTLMVIAFQKRAAIRTEKYSKFFALNTRVKLLPYKNKLGLSERKFKSFLFEHYKDSLITNICFEFRGYPDFLLKIKIEDFQVILNIEIDEPYAAETGELLHFLDEDYDGSISYIDSLRDSVLNDNGIIVIRFAEEQVVKYPHECIEFIDSIINHIDKTHFPEDEYYNCKVVTVKRWTVEEARKLANEDYRNSYLPNKTPTKEERGHIYLPQDFEGVWKNKDNYFVIGQENKRGNNKIISDSNYSYGAVIDNQRLVGNVFIEKDILSISIKKIQGRKLYANSPTWKFRVIKLDENELTYLDLKTGKIFLYVR